MTRRRGLRVTALAAGIAVLAALPQLLGPYRTSQAALVAVYFVALLGLNVLTGWSGQVSLGHGAFMALGAYTTAILVSDQGLSLGGHVFRSDLRDLWTIPLAGLVAGLAGVLFALPALRLTGVHLALATFAVAVSLPAVLKRAESLTGGTPGINLFGLPGHTGGIGGVHVLGRHLGFEDWLYLVCWAVALALWLAARALVGGRTGRALAAVRDSPAAAAASGISPARVKTLAFGVSAFYAGVAGSLYAIAVTFVNPDSFPVTLSVILLAGVVVGGLGSLWPLLAGALLIETLPDLAERVSREPGVPSVVYGGLLIALMLVAPGGLAGALRRVSAALDGRYTRPSARGPAGPASQEPS